MSESNIVFSFTGFVKIPKIREKHNGMLAAENYYEIVGREKQQAEGYKPTVYEKYSRLAGFIRN